MAQGEVVMIDSFSETSGDENKIVTVKCAQMIVNCFRSCLFQLNLCICHSIVFRHVYTLKSRLKKDLEKFNEWLIELCLVMCLFDNLYPVQHCSSGNQDVKNIVVLLKDEV